MSKYRNWKGQWEKISFLYEFKKGDFCWFWSDDHKKSDVIAGPFLMEDKTPDFTSLEQRSTFVCASLPNKKFKFCKLVRGGMQSEWKRLFYRGK